MNLKELIRVETRKAITEAISAQEKKDLADLGARLATWADRFYQTEMKNTKNEPELRAMAEKDHANYLKVADFLKNGDGEKASALVDRLDTAVRDAMPAAIWNGLQGLEDRAIAEEELADQLMFFDAELKSFKALVKDRNWTAALDRWKDIQRVAAADVKDALEELA